MHSFTGSYVIASEQSLYLICYTNNLIAFIWSYIHWIYKKRYIKLLHILVLIPWNIWYNKWNTQYIPYIRWHIISAHHLNSYDRPHNGLLLPAWNTEFIKVLILFLKLYNIIV
jgi:hypothetical protein